MTVSPGWRKSVPKCPMCHLTRVHEKDCPYEHLSIEQALEQYFIDRQTPDVYKGQAED